MSSSERSGYYEFDLDTSLETFVDGYEQDRDAFWQERSESDEWSPLKQLRDDADDIAAAIRHRARSLQNIGSAADINAIRQTYAAEVDAAREHQRELFEKVKPSLEEHVKNKKLSRKQADELLEWFKTLPQEGIEEGHEPPDETDRPFRLVWERLCIDDAWEVVGTIRDRVRRTLELERLIWKTLRHGQIPDATVEFLGKVSRCYVYGFVPECVTMCRSAMDSVFRDRVSDDACRQAKQRPTRHGYSLGARIEAAFHPHTNLLKDMELLKVARRVRTAGDTAVHKDPTVGKDAMGLIRDTLQLIEALTRLPSPDDAG